MTSSTTEPVNPVRAPRVAVVGAGLMGRWHAQAALRAGGRIVAIVDVDTDRGARLSARLTGSRAVPALSDVLADVDVVHICTPAATHVALAIAAIRAGRHVLIEKPLAPSVDATAELLDLAARHGVLACPVHQFPFQDGARAAIEGLPTIGPLRHVVFRTCSAGASDADAARVALEILPHPLSLLARMLSPTKPLDWVVRSPGGGEIGAMAQVGDVMVSLLISMSGRPTFNGFDLIGAGGTTSVNLFHGFAVTHDGRVSRFRKAAQPFLAATSTSAAAAVNLAKRSWRREPAYPGLRELVKAFYAGATGAGPSPIPAAETLWVAEAGEQLAQLVQADASRRLRS